MIDDVKLVPTDKQPSIDSSILEGWNYIHFPMTVKLMHFVELEVAEFGSSEKYALYNNYL